MATSVFAGLPPAQLHLLKAAYLASMEQLDQKEAELKTQMSALADVRAKVQGLMRELDQTITRSDRPEAAADGQAVGSAASHEPKPLAGRTRTRARATTKPAPG